MKSYIGLYLFKTFLLVTLNNASDYWANWLTDWVRVSSLLSSPLARYIVNIIVTPTLDEWQLERFEIDDSY